MRNLLIFRADKRAFVYVFCSERVRIAFRNPLIDYIVHINYLMLFKITFEKEIHVVRSEHTSSLPALKQLIPTIFKKYPKKFYLTYFDEEGDEITLANESDFNMILKGQQKSVKINIRQKSEEFYDETQVLQLSE